MKRDSVVVLIWGFLTLGVVVSVGAGVYMFMAHGIPWIIEFLAINGVKFP